MIMVMLNRDQMGHDIMVSVFGQTGSPGHARSACVGSLLALGSRFCSTSHILR
jgi:hypothetical protein